MKMLEDRIRADGIVREGNVLKVDSFINHQMDIPLFPQGAEILPFKAGALATSADVYHHAHLGQQQDEAGAAGGEEGQ